MIENPQIQSGQNANLLIVKAGTTGPNKIKWQYFTSTFSVAVREK
jgi:hypothetical protein